MILNAILKLVWLIFVQGPLNLIAAFTKVLEYLTGGIINDILFGSQKEFHWNNIPMQFWWFIIISLCIFSLIFVIQMIILIFKEAIETKTKFVIAMQNGVKAFAFMFLIPIFFFIANFIVQSLANTIINNFGNNSNIAAYLWHIGDPNWDGSSDLVPPDYGYPSNLNQYNMMAQIFGTWFMLFAIFMIGIVLVQKIIELFFLFVISPIVMVVMVIDNGKAAFTWKDMVIAKFLASSGTLIGYYIFISVTQILLSSQLAGLDSGKFTKSLFIILFLCGGGLATMGFCDMVASFVGEAVGINEARASFRSTMRGGMMAMGAGKMVGKAMGFAKSKRAKGLLSGLGNSSSNNSTLSDNTNDTEEENKKINTSTFRNATTGMFSRSGIIGLTGFALGATGATVGHMTGASKGAWKSGNRKTFWGKTRGVARVITKASTAPIIVPTKKVASGIKNTYQVSRNSAAVAHSSSQEKYPKFIANESEKNENTINQVVNEDKAILLAKEEYRIKINKTIEKKQQRKKFK